MWGFKISLNTTFRRFNVKFFCVFEHYSISLLGCVKLYNNLGMFRLLPRITCPNKREFCEGKHSEESMMLRMVNWSHVESRGLRSGYADTLSEKDSHRHLGHRIICLSLSS